MITLHFSVHSNNRGRGFWKLNTSFLNDPEDMFNLIQSTIQEAQNEYVKDDYVNPNLMWEMLKLKVRERLIKSVAIKKIKWLRNKMKLNRCLQLEKSSYLASHWMTLKSKAYGHNFKQIRKS